ncbi:terminase small subunit [Nitrosococcus wardiae]|uniref:Terminase small subunit n=2 Tax=Nitrosococcus wardiae TaxID=1814290 RepID=A0A4P7C681_9GAMM|nr:terminase small subunit [Nitrosococcus wardiae]
MRQARYPRNEDGLTPGQQTFADLYRAGPEKVRGNALACYRQAFPQAALSTAKVQSSRLLRNPVVATYLQSKRQAAEAEADVNESQVLKELAKVGFSDIRALFDREGRLKPIHDLPDEIAAAVAAVEVVVMKGEQGEEPLYVYKIKLWNKLDALEKLGKQLGMFKEQKDMNVKGGLTHLLEEISGSPLSTPMGRIKAAQEGMLPDYYAELGE